jgi:hypothetical protein
MYIQISLLFKKRIQEKIALVDSVKSRLHNFVISSYNVIYIFQVDHKEKLKKKM